MGEGEVPDDLQFEIPFKASRSSATPLTVVWPIWAGYENHKNPGHLANHKQVMLLSELILMSPTGRFVFLLVGTLWAVKIPHDQRWKLISSWSTVRECPVTLKKRLTAGLRSALAGVKRNCLVWKQVCSRGLQEQAYMWQDRGGHFFAYTCRTCTEASHFMRYKSRARASALVSCWTEFEEEHGFHQIQAYFIILV